MHLSGLIIYPVKSLRGIAVPAVELDEWGLVGDRRFLVVDANNQFLTQRTLPRMAQIETAIEGGNLILRNPHHGSAAVSFAESGPGTTVQIWRDSVTAIDCGVEIAVWLSDFLRHPCKLVRTGPDFARPVHKPAAHPGDKVGFADAAPALVISEASLAVLNDRILEHGGEPVPMNRFRPNFVISGCDAFAEDECTTLEIGDCVFRAAGRSERCIMPGIDQLTGDRNNEPLRTLAIFRRDPNKPSAVHFGQNLINQSKTGTVRLGTSVELIA